MDHLIEDTRVLLQAAQQIHAERHGAQTFTPGTHLPLEEAGRRSGLDPNRQRYHDAIEELEYEGAIEWDESARYARGDKHFLITERGLKMLRENPTRCPPPRALDFPPEEVSPVTGAANKRGGTHVATYSSRGVGLHARRPG